jgi:uncharacterized surface protein with fasciclin (FAS1) repeats
VDTLLKPENKAQLTQILTYHVVAGKVTAADLIAKIKAGGGSARPHHGGRRTADRQPRWQQRGADRAKGGKATVTIADVPQSNGVVHVINAVLMP